MPTILVKIIFLFFLLTGSCVSGAGQTAPNKSGDAKPPFTLEITAGRDGHTAGGWDFVNRDGTFAQSTSMLEIAIAVRKTNISHRVIDKLSVEDGAGGYSYQVLDSSGNPVGPRRSDSLEPGDGRGMLILGTKDMLLQPAETRVTDALLGRWYDMSRPGTYTVQVSAHVSKNSKSDIVKSNKIRVVVTP